MATDLSNSFEDKKSIPPKEEPKLPPNEKITPTARDKIDFIVIDPGHGGKDPGAVSKTGVREKDIALSISKLIVAELNKNLADTEIILTRKTDLFIELDKRSNIANSKLKKNKNGIFVSIHLNASLSDKISGTETYYLSQNPSGDEARNTAALENNVVKLETNSGKGNYQDIDYIEARMMTTQIQKESELLADLIQKSLIKGLKDFKNRGVKKADFAVLRGTLMPAVLIEVGYITNVSDLSKLTKKNYQESAAKAISNGIVQFINNYDKSLK
jgi:N-acetylmuramoyl-L-alanine amidase